MKIYLISTLYEEQKQLFFYHNPNRYLMNISLPSNENGKINYNLMEAYIRAIEKKVIKNVVDWKDAVIAKTKEVVKQ